MVSLLWISCGSLPWLGAQEAAEILEKRMAAELMAMPLQDALPITRACGHYLNLTGIAEIHHRCLQHRV